MEQNNNVLYCDLHKFEWTFNKLNKSKCRFCKCNEPTIDQITKFISDKNGTLISFSDKKDGRWYKIKCNVHQTIWDVRWRTLTKRKSWCRKCFFDRIRISYDDINNLVISRNGILLSENCSGSLEKFRIRCSECLYEWETNWTILKMGSWCPKCSKVAPHTIEEIQNLVSEKGGTLLDTHVNGVRDKIQIKCSCENIFTLDLGNFLRGNWCSKCSEKYKTQKELSKIIEDLFPDKKIHTCYRGFDWLRYVDKLEIDIWVPEMKLAIEYDGLQHFRPVKYFGAKTDEDAQKAFDIISARDAKKNELIAAHSNEIKHFVRFNYSETITKEFVEQKLKQELNNER